MAKRIRFPLILDKDAEARNLEELRTNFSLRAVLEYYENGKLLTWLENLYLLDEADQIRELNKEDSDFQRSLCGIFQVEYTRDMDPKVIEQRKKRLERLRAVTDEDGLYRMVDYVAFDQEDLADLLDEGERTIYLCREEGKEFTFTIPASCTGITYTGIITHSGQRPRVRISGGTLEDMEKFGITVEFCDVEQPRPLKQKKAQMLTDSSASVLPEGGTVIAVGLNSYGQCDLKSWKNIVSIACGDCHTVGLKKDGTVVATGYNANNQCKVEAWRDIVSIACGDGYTVGLKKDGTVIATGYNIFGQCDVKSWKDIISIACGDGYTIGLKKNGTIVTTGYNGKKQCDVESWRNIVSIACGCSHTVGLQKDGTTIAVGLNGNGQCSVESWVDIVSVACGKYHTVGLKKNGTLAIAGANKKGQRSIESWKDVVSIACGNNYTIGLKKDGTIVATEYYDYKNTVETWRDIIFIDSGANHTVAIQKP